MADDAIWVVGDNNSNADKTFQWTEPIPDITDANVLIIDLSTFPAKPANYHEPSIRSSGHEASPPPWIVRYIQNWQTSVTANLKGRLTSGGQVIFLLDYNCVSDFMSRMGLLPFGITIVEKQKRNIQYDKEHTFKKYLQYAKQANYVLQIPNSIQGLESVSDVRLLGGYDSKIKDNSNRLLGISYNVDSNEGTSGRITLMPSITGTAREQALDEIIAVFKSSVAESPPQWAESVLIPGEEKIKREIMDLVNKKNAIESNISKLESKKRNLCKYRQLLYSDGTLLEKSVKRAFTKLGLTDIDDGEVGKEDLVMKINSIHENTFGIIEVKGRKKQAEIDDIDQCIRWARTYQHDNPSVVVKGILVMNQLRLQPFPASITERNRFTAQHINYAEINNTCIIPTSVLFEAVTMILSENQLDKTKIEQKIFNTNGVLTSLF